MAEITAVIPGEPTGPREARPDDRLHETRDPSRTIASCGLWVPALVLRTRPGSQWRLRMPIRAFVFDAYGTLFDVHAAIARHREPAGPEADRLSEIWRAKQLEYAWMLSAAGHYVDFWTLTGRALDHALARCPTVDRALRATLLDAYFELDAFPDARDALHALHAQGLKTAILSNGSPRMLDGAVTAAGNRPP